MCNTKRQRQAHQQHTPQQSITGLNMLQKGVLLSWHKQTNTHVTVCWGISCALLRCQVASADMLVYWTAPMY